MKQLFGILLAFSFTITGVCQDELAENDLGAKYLDSFLKDCKKRHAQYIREVQKNDFGRFEATLVSVYGDTVFIGEYSDPDCTTPHGRFAYFHENGEAKSIGYYSSARKVGLWKHYKDDGTSKPSVKYNKEVPKELLAVNPSEKEPEGDQLADPVALAAAEEAAHVAESSEEKAVNAVPEKETEEDQQVDSAAEKAAKTNVTSKKEEGQLADPVALAAAEEAMSAAKRSEEKAKAVKPKAIGPQHNATSTPPKSNKRSIQDFGLPMVW